MLNYQAANHRLISRTFDRKFSVLHRTARWLRVERVTCCFPHNVTLQLTRSSCETTTLSRVLAVRAAGSVRSRRFEIDFRKPSARKRCVNVVKALCEHRVTVVKAL